MCTENASEDVNEAGDAMEDVAIDGLGNKAGIRSRTTITAGMGLVWATRHVTLYTPVKDNFSDAF